MPRTINYFTTASALILGIFGICGLATMSGAKLLVYAALLAMAVIVLVSESRGARYAAVDAQRSVTFYNRTLTYKTAENTHAIQITDIKRVDIVTNDRGPFENDMFWCIETGGEVVMVPSVADDTNALFDMLDQLGDANYVAAMEAGFCTSNASFAVWPAPDHVPV
ncbi:MAG: hypothetical protein ACPG5U_07180 [Planktomarina sp.]